MSIFSVLKTTFKAERESYIYYRLIFLDMKYLFIIAFTFLHIFLYGQNTAISESQFVQIEMNKLKKHFNTPELSLQNEQISKLQPLLSQKYAKVYKSWNSGLTKEQVSQRRTEIDTEYSPLVEAILTPQQRIALLKAKPAPSK